MAAASQDAPTGIDSVSGGTSGGWDTEFQIDGISGSTLTGKGVSNLLQFWLGENGFGPFLRTARETGV